MSENSIKGSTSLHTTANDAAGVVNLVMGIADILRGPYQSDHYKDVIIPMVIIRRFECALAKTKKDVLRHKERSPIELCSISGFQFYNTSEFNLEKLLDEEDCIAENFKSYIKKFSSNVLDILKKLKFFEQINTMSTHRRLYGVVQAFAALDISPETVNNITMGYIFEELIRQFSENAEAGDHYTGRDIIGLMVEILLAEGCDDLSQDRKVVTILDQACGTGGMLSTGYDMIKKNYPRADVRLFGQEINPESYAICLAEMLIKGQNADNIRCKDTLEKDCFKGEKMRFVLENPPFGTAWGGENLKDSERAVKGEYKKADSRWGAGLPRTSDAQMLFLQSAVDKMDDTVGRCAIIHNASPLFSGATASGESQIRHSLLDKDLIEAIIALPTDLFYNTGLATYIWVLSKNKRPERKGKVQLIDASNIYHKLHKALGHKKRELKPEDRENIKKLYAKFEENERCKIYKKEEFFYREYSVMQPLQRRYEITEESIAAMRTNGAISDLYDETKVAELERAMGDVEKQETKDKKKLEKLQKDKKRLEKFWENKPLYDAIMNALTASISEKRYLSLSAFEPVLASALKSVVGDKRLLEKVARGLSRMDKSAEIHIKNGEVLYDEETRTYEFLKIEDNIDEYMKREILPHIPDAKAFFEENLSKRKPVIKTGAEIPFTRYFYKYQKPAPSETLEAKFLEKEKSVSECVTRLFK